MTTHSRHPDIHNFGLADGCERCLELALNPFNGLDENALTDLAARVAGDSEPRSDAEAMAMRPVRLTIQRAAWLMRVGVL